MEILSSLFQVRNIAMAMPLIFAGILLAILIVSFRSRAVMFCQYLERMTGIKLKPSDVAFAFKTTGQSGVRELFLDRIIRQDLKEEGPREIPCPAVHDEAEPVDLNPPRVVKR